MNYPLRYDSERKWLKKRIDYALTVIQAKKEEAEEEKRRGEEHLQNEKQMKRRLVKGKLPCALILVNTCLI